jgi:hypothetical protein
VGWYVLGPNQCINPSFGGDGRFAVYLFFSTKISVAGGVVPKGGDEPKFCVDSKDAFELKNEFCSYHTDLRYETFGRLVWPNAAASRKFTLPPF